MIYFNDKTTTLIIQFSSPLQTFQPLAIFNKKKKTFFFKDKLNIAALI